MGPEGDTTYRSQLKHNGYVNKIRLHETYDIHVTVYRTGSMPALVWFESTTVIMSLAPTVEQRLAHIHG